MKLIKKISYLIVIGILFSACSKNEAPPNSLPTGNELESGWLVPINQLILSQLPPDRIHSIDAPHFETLSSENLRADETVYIYRFGDIVKIYPQRIMGVHEIVNDHIDDHHFAVTFCPLTGSAVAWNREINGTVAEFGVSGHLFNENLIPYDRNDSSFWSQMRLQSIKGNHAGQQLESHTLVLTKGQTVKNSFPNALVLIDTSGHNCDSICGDFKSGRDLGDPNESDIELPGGDLFGIVNGEAALLFNYAVFEDPIKIYHTNFRNSKVIVTGSETLQFIVAFIDKTGDPNIQFSVIQDELPIIFKDNKGNRYDMTGLVVSGPSAGNRLSSPIAYTAHSFAWKLFFNKLELFEE